MKNFKWCVACVAGLLSAAAAAQDSETYSDDRPADRTEREARREARREAKQRALLTKGVGLQVEVGGGVQKFIDRTTSDITDAAGAWTARLIIGTRSHIAGEAAYVGSAQALDALGVADKAMLTSNGVEGLLRVNVLTGPWQPYAAAGYTFRRYDIANSAVNTSSVVDGANVNELPLAAGIAYRFRPLVTDLRFTLRNAFGTPLLPDANLSTYSIDAKVGFEF